MSCHATCEVLDTVAAVAAATDTVLNLVTGTVTATGNATVAEATTLQGFTHAVVYDILDTGGNVAGASAAVLDDAFHLVISGSATVAQATTAEAALNTGNTAIDSVLDTAANLAASSDPVLDLVTGSVAVLGGATAAQAATLLGFNHSVIFDINDTAANMAGAAGATLDGAFNIANTDGGSAADLAVIFGASPSGDTDLVLSNAHTTGGTFAMVVGDSLDIDASNTTAALVTDAGSAGAVDAAGEYHFDGSVFTWWDGAADSITLTGVTAISVIADGFGVTG